MLVPMVTMESDRPVEVKRVLQFRYYTGTAYKDNRRGADEGWSFWRDIPEVHEADTLKEDALFGDQ
jgi:ribulose bisphosphate carboxylase small subunit